MGARLMVALWVSCAVPGTQEEDSNEESRRVWLLFQGGKELHKDQACREAETLKKVPKGRGLPPGHVLGLALFWGLQEPESSIWGCSRPDRALDRSYST